MHRSQIQGGINELRTEATGGDRKPDTSQRGLDTEDELGDTVAAASTQTFPDLLLPALLGMHYLAKVQLMN